jgi:hypothetical protein
MRARNDTLWTQARKAMMLKEDGPTRGCICGNKRFCHLFHILNNCIYNMKEMTVRHNMIQGVLVDVLKKNRKLGADDIWTNKEIYFGKFKKEVGEQTLGEEARQRPYIQFWVNASEENDVIEAWNFFIV